MDVRVITLRYQDALQGFSEEALRKAISRREVLELMPDVTAPVPAVAEQPASEEKAEINGQ